MKKIYNFLSDIFYLSIVFIGISIGYILIVIDIFKERLNNAESKKESK